MFDQEELNRIRSKSDEQKLDEILNVPETFCADMIYLIDYHLTTDLKDSMRIHLIELKNRIINDNEAYLTDQLALVLELLLREDEVTP